jgi:hypothetical protein
MLVRRASFLDFAPRVLALALASCRGSAPAGVDPAPVAPASQAVAPAPSARASEAAAPASEPAAASALPAPAALPSPASSAAVDPENRIKPPLTSDDLVERASHLLDAIVRGEPSLADDFFFPRAPFIPLKDVADPGRYFDQLLSTYHRDIMAIRKSKKSWEGASFVSFELGTVPGWVAPGKEYNKIGYFRTFHGKLRYALGNGGGTIDVTTIISWDGRWYVTHFAPIQH